MGGRKCVVADCNVTERTPRKSPIFNHVHPTARGMMFQLSAERKRVWKDILHLEHIAASEVQVVCCRHFSLLQFNELRLSRGCRFNILSQEAYPDIFLPGKENSPVAVMYQEIILTEKTFEEELDPGNNHEDDECIPTVSNLLKEAPKKVPNMDSEISLENETRPINEDEEFETNEILMPNQEQGACASEKNCVR